MKQMINRTQYKEVADIIYSKWLERTKYDTEEVAALQTIKELEDWFK